MTASRWWWSVALCCVSCHSLAVLEKEKEDPAASASASAEKQPNVGAQAPPTVPSQVDLSSGPNQLVLAAALLEEGDVEEACRQLAKYVKAHPEQLAVRSRFADLLVRLQRGREARTEFERLDADMQEQTEDDINIRIHCQRCLLDLADANQDEYGEHLHRGIGLFLLARARAALPEPDGDLSFEGLLFQAAAELSLAHRRRPEEARPSWYLYETWHCLGQRPTAIRHLRQAEASAHFTSLVSAEQRALDLAWQELQIEERRK